MLDTRFPLPYTPPMSTTAHALLHHDVTWDAFIDLPDDDRRELIDGVLLETEVPNELHEWIVAAIVQVLMNWAEAHGGRTLGSGFKVRINSRRGFMPDVQYYRPGRSGPKPRKALEHGAPDLVVEVISPSSRRIDRKQKLDGYAAIHAPEYWIVDPEAQTLERLVLDGATYRIAEAHGPDEVFEPDSFPGLRIVLARLFTLPV